MSTDTTPALPAVIDGLDWWSQETGSLTINGIDAINIMIESADTVEGKSLSVEEIDAARDWIVTVISDALAATKGA